MTRLWRHLDTVVTREGSLRAIGILRALLGGAVIVHMWPNLHADVLPVERFHVPWWSWLPEPSAAGYEALAVLGVLAGIGMILGPATRAATLVAFLVVTYLLLIDMTAFGHNRAFLVWLLAGLVLVSHRPIAGLRSRSSSSPSADIGVLWPVFMLRIVVSSVYLASGFSKLANPDWRDGLVLWDRVVRFQAEIPFGGWLLEIATSRWLYALVAPGALAVELFIGFGLWFPRTRLAAVWTALVFHTSIELFASVQTFSYTAIAALLLWVTPKTRDRVILTGSERLVWTVRSFDWLYRFEIAADARESRDGATVLLDREGTVRSDRDARLTVLSRLPLFFPFVAPSLALHRFRHRATAPTRS